MNVRRLIPLVTLLATPLAGSALSGCGCEESVFACLTGDASHQVFPLPEIPEIGVHAVAWRDTQPAPPWNPASSAYAWLFGH